MDKKIDHCIGVNAATGEIIGDDIAEPLYEGKPLKVVKLVRGLKKPNRTKNSK